MSAISRFIYTTSTTRSRILTFMHHMQHTPSFPSRVPCTLQMPFPCWLERVCTCCRGKPLDRFRRLRWRRRRWPLFFFFPVGRDLIEILLYASRTIFRFQAYMFSVLWYFMEKLINFYNLSSNSMCNSTKFATTIYLNFQNIIFTQRLFYY